MLVERLYRSGCNGKRASRYKPTSDEGLPPSFRWASINNTRCRAIERFFPFIFTVERTRRVPLQKPQGGIDSDSRRSTNTQGRPANRDKFSRDAHP